MTAANILTQITEVVKVEDLKPFGKNPRKGDVDMIAESLKQHGQYRPLIVRKDTMEVLAGNHTLKAAQKLGWKKIAVNVIDVNEDQAKRIVLVDNRTQDAATYDTDLLAEILATMPDPTVGTGFEDQAVRKLLAGIEDRDADLVTEAIRPQIEVNFDGEAEDWDLASGIKATQERRSKVVEEDHLEQGTTAGEGTFSEELAVAESIATIQYDLEKYEEQRFPSSNYWGVPDLDPNMLLDELPDDLTTWGGQDATPDDGKSTYLWNYGLAASKGLPWDRAIASFFTYDTKFESLFHQPAFRVAQFVHNGLNRAIVPDTSFWVDDPRFLHLSAAYNAQWMGRFMQYAGMKVIPRLMWCDLESIKVGSLGIPKNPPIAAVCIQAINKKEAADQMAPEGLRLFIKEIQPEALIVYGSGTAKQIVEQAVLPKELHVVHVPNYAAVRRHVVFDNPTGKQAVEKAQRRARKAAKAATASTGTGHEVEGDDGDGG